MERFIFLKEVLKEDNCLKSLLNLLSVCLPNKTILPWPGPDDGDGVWPRVVVGLNIL